MKTNRLLYLSAHRMTAFRWRSGELTEDGLFQATDDGYQQFATYVANNPRAVFTMLVNVAEEGFHAETIPFLQGADRTAVIRRKLGQQFFGATLTASQSLGYEKSKRKDERLLLAALTNNEFFAPWLQALATRDAALAGIYSLPLLAPSLLRKLNLAGEPCLLLTVQDQSIRQSYFDKGELYFSRLAPLQNSSIGGIAQTLATEAIKLQQYLASQRQIGRNQQITAHVLAHGSALKAIQASCNDTPTIRFNVLGIEDCAKRTGLKTLPADTHSELIFLNLLMTAPPRIQFASDAQRHGYHLTQIRTGLQTVDALTLAGCLLFSGKQWLDTRSIRQENHALQVESLTARQRYNEIVKTFPPIPTNNDTLRRVIDRYSELEKQAATPNGFYRELSRALDAVPSVELTTLEWKIGGSEAAKSAPAPRAASESGIAGGNEALVLSGVITLGPTANARQTIATFNQLLDTLKANPALQVNVLQSPVDIESSKALRSGETQSDEMKPHMFALQIVRKLAS